MDSWRDLIIDAIRERLIITRGATFDIASEEAKDLCDSIFDALEVGPELQDIPWNTIARAITGRDFSVL